MPEGRGVRTERKVRVFGTCFAPGVGRTGLCRLSMKQPRAALGEHFREVRPGSGEDVDDVAAFNGCVARFLLSRCDCSDILGDPCAAFDGLISSNGIAFGIGAVDQPVACVCGWDFAPITLIFLR